MVWINVLIKGISTCNALLFKLVQVLIKYNK